MQCSTTRNAFAKVGERLKLEENHLFLLSYIERSFGQYVYPTMNVWRQAHLFRSTIQGLWSDAFSNFYMPHPKWSGPEWNQHQGSQIIIVPKESLRLKKDWVETRTCGTARYSVMKKRWWLDGPDGNAYYWSCKDLDPKNFSKRQRVGRSLMVWGCFSARGAPQLKIIEGNLNSQQYCEILSDIMIPFGESAYNWEWRFQQDNASVHTSGHKNQFFVDMDVNVLDWPECSSDMKPIENL